MNYKTKDIEYWLKVENDIEEWLRTKPKEEDIEKLYTESNYEVIKLICSGYRYEKKKNQFK